MMKSVLGLGLALLAGIGSGSAGAMTSSNPATVECTVQGAGKLPAGLDAAAVCAAVRAATQPALAASGASALSVKVTVVSESKLMAVATLGGEALPEHHVASSDRSLNARAVDMLAQAIAADIPAHGRVSGA
jgi:hypothetical protein